VELKIAASRRCTSGRDLVWSAEWLPGLAVLNNISPKERRRRRKKRVSLRSIVIYDFLSLLHLNITSECSERVLKYIS
jgi:hypothetical protein